MEAGLVCQVGSTVRPGTVVTVSKSGSGRAKGIEAGSAGREQARPREVAPRLQNAQFRMLLANPYPLCGRVSRPVLTGHKARTLLKIHLGRTALESRPHRSANIVKARGETPKN